MLQEGLYCTSVGTEPVISLFCFTSDHGKQMVELFCLAIFSGIVRTRAIGLDIRLIPISRSAPYKDVSNFYPACNFRRLFGCGGKIRTSVTGEWAQCPSIRRPRHDTVLFPLSGAYTSRTGKPFPSQGMIHCNGCTSRTSVDIWPVYPHRRTMYVVLPSTTMNPYTGHRIPVPVEILA